MSKYYEEVIRKDLLDRIAGMELTISSYQQRNELFAARIVELEIALTDWEQRNFNNWKRANELEKDAVIGRVVWKFIDRMNDVSTRDSAGVILDQFLDAVNPAINNALKEKENER